MILSPPIKKENTKSSVVKYHWSVRHINMLLSSITWSILDHVTRKTMCLYTITYNSYRDHPPIPWIDIIFKGVYSCSTTDNMPVVAIKDYSFSTMPNQNKNRGFLTWWQYIPYTLANVASSPPHKWHNTEYRSKGTRDSVQKQVD